MLSRTVTSSRMWVFEAGHDPRTGALSFSAEPVPAQVTQIRGQDEGTAPGHKSPGGTWDMVSFAPGLSSLGLVPDTKREDMKYQLIATSPQPHLSAIRCPKKGQDEVSKTKLDHFLWFLHW